MPKDELTDIFCQQEIVLCIYKGGNLTGIVKKNGKITLMRVEEMNIKDVGELLNEQSIKSDITKN